MKQRNRFLAGIDWFVVAIGLVLTFAADNVARWFSKFKNTDSFFVDIGTALTAAGLVSLINNRVIRLNNIFLAILGLIFVSLGNNFGGFMPTDFDASVNKFLVNLGVGFISVSFTEFIKYSLMIKANSSNPTIEIFSNERRSLDENYRIAKLNSNTSIDILGVSINSSLSDFCNDVKIQDRFFQRNMTIRILFMFPEENLISLRSSSDGRSSQIIADKIIKSVSDSEILLEKIKNARNRKQNKSLNCTSSIEVRVFKQHPLFVYLQSDNSQAYWGIFTSDGSGTREPVIKISKDESTEVLFNRLNSHFSSLWTSETTERLMCFDAHENNSPYFNKALAEKITKTQVTN